MLYVLLQSVRNVYWRAGFKWRFFYLCLYPLSFCAWRTFGHFSKCVMTSLACATASCSTPLTYLMSGTSARWGKPSVAQASVGFFFFFLKPKSSSSRVDKFLFCLKIVKEVDNSSTCRLVTFKTGCSLSTSGETGGRGWTSEQMQSHEFTLLPNFCCLFYSEHISLFEAEVEVFWAWDDREHSSRPGFNFDMSHRVQ